MPLDSTELKKWLETLPHSKMVFPKKLSDRLKYILWLFLIPLHSLMRDTSQMLHITRHKGRQRFLIGKLSPNYDIREIALHLTKNGYGNHFIAWKDDDEILSLRRTVDFTYQYHLRIFKDGEVRGHYEYTPESHPLLHMRAVNQEDRKEEFLKVLGDRIIASTS